MMRERKAILRRKAYAARQAQNEKDRSSQRICARFIDSEPFQQADVVMLYIHCHSEVRTNTVLARALTMNKQVAVPFCTEDAQGKRVLGLWQMRTLSELRPGTWGILEPPRERWAEIDRIVTPAALDLIMVPGVGFDRQGGRLGNGAGYYDRLFRGVRKDCVLAAVGYESQLFSEIPMEEHDVYMDYVFTEDHCYSGKGR